MPVSLQAFWQFIESRPRATALLQEWKDGTGECFHVVAPLLHPRSETLHSFPNPRPWCAPMTLVRRRDSRVVAIDPDDPAHRLELAPASVVPYELHLPTLRQVVCKALGLESARAPIAEPTRDLLLGTWEPRKAVRYPVRFVRAYGRQQLAELVFRRMASETQGILLTPTRRLWQEHVYDAARRRGLLLLPLTEVLADDALRATPCWRECLEAFDVPTKRCRPRRKRADRAVKIERLRKALVDHFRAARDHAYSSAERGEEPALLPRPSKSLLARIAGVEPHDVTRCFRDDPQLVRLYEMADCLEDVMRFGR